MSRVEAVGTLELFDSFGDHSQKWSKDRLTLYERLAFEASLFLSPSH